MKDECHFLFTRSIYSAIHSRYVDILRGSDNVSTILKTPPRRLSSYVYALFTHKDFVLQCMNTPSQEGDTYQEHMYTLVPQVKIGLFMHDKNSNSNSVVLVDLAKLSEFHSIHLAYVSINLSFFVLQSCFCLPSQTTVSKRFYKDHAYLANKSHSLTQSQVPKSSITR